jgi:putative endonuclease
MYYVGSSHNPIRRLSQHNAGATASTKNKGPWEIKLTQQYPTIIEARQIEHKIKKLKRRDLIEQIIKDGKIKMK